MEIKGEKLNDELVMEIGKFSILWNCFERFQCNNFCTAKKIKEVCSLVSIDEAKQAELDAVRTSAQAELETKQSEIIRLRALLAKHGITLNA